MPDRGFDDVFRWLDKHPARGVKAGLTKDVGERFWELLWNTSDTQPIAVACRSCSAAVSFDA